MAVEAVLKEDLTEHSLQDYNQPLYERFILWKDVSGKSLGSIAVMVNRSTAAISQYVNRKYNGNIAELEKDVANLLEREENLEFVTGAKEFCSTEPAVLMWELLQYCDQRAKMGVILKASGIGGTETAKEYKRRNRASIFVTADVSTRRVGSVLNRIVLRVGGVSPRRSISDKLHGLIDKLKGSRRLIIIDDAHFLSWEAFECVRKLYDCAGVGVVYIGQPRLYDAMRGVDGRAYLYDQIYSRISIRREDFRVLKKDVRMISDSIHPGLGKECIDYLFRKAQGKGHFRVIANLLDVAAAMERENQTPLNIGILREADKFLMI